MEERETNPAAAPGPPPAYVTARLNTSPVRYFLVYEPISIDFISMCYLKTLPVAYIESSAILFDLVCIFMWMSMSEFVFILTAQLGLLFLYRGQSILFLSLPLISVNIYLPVSYYFVQIFCTRIATFHRLLVVTIFNQIRAIRRLHTHTNFSTQFLAPDPYS